MNWHCYRCCWSLCCGKLIYLFIYSTKWLYICKRINYICNIVHCFVKLLFSYSDYEFFESLNRELGQCCSGERVESIKVKGKSKKRAVFTLLPLGEINAELGMWLYRMNVCIRLCVTVCVCVYVFVCVCVFLSLFNLFYMLFWKPEINIVTFH